MGIDNVGKRSKTSWVKRIFSAFKKSDVKNTVIVDEYLASFNKKMKKTFKDLSVRKLVISNSNHEDVKIEYMNYKLKINERMYVVWFFARYNVFKVGYVEENDEIKILFYNIKTKEFNILNIITLSDDYEFPSKTLNKAKKMVRRNTKELDAFCTHYKTKQRYKILKLNRRD